MEAINKITYPNELAPRGDTMDKYKKGDGTETEVNDAYRFLEDPDAEATKKWVTAQNEVTDKHMATCELRDKIKDKLTQIWNFAKIGLVNKHGDHYYFTFNSGLQS